MRTPGSLFVDTGIGVGATPAGYEILVSKSRLNAAVWAIIQNTGADAGVTHADVILEWKADNWATADWLIATGLKHIDGVGTNFIIRNQNLGLNVAYFTTAGDLQLLVNTRSQGAIDLLVAAYPVGDVGQGLTRVCPIKGSINFQTIEATVQIRTAAGTLRKLRVYVTGNGCTANSTVTVRKNGAATALTLTIGAGATGVFTDDVNTVTVAAGDLLNYQVVAGAGIGNLSFAILQCELV